MINVLARGQIIIIIILHTGVLHTGIQIVHTRKSTHGQVGLAAHSTRVSGDTSTVPVQTLYCVAAEPGLQSRLDIFCNWFLPLFFMRS